MVKCQKSNEVCSVEETYMFYLLYTKNNETQKKCCRESAVLKASIHKIGKTLMFWRTDFVVGNLASALSFKRFIPCCNFETRNFWI